jgi:hypothetical protein
MVNLTNFTTCKYPCKAPIEDMEKQKKKDNIWRTIAEPVFHGNAVFYDLEPRHNDVKKERKNRSSCEGFPRVSRKSGNKRAGPTFTIEPALCNLSDTT